MTQHDPKERNRPGCDEAEETTHEQPGGGGQAGEKPSDGIIEHPRTPGGGDDGIIEHPLAPGGGGK